MQALDKFVKDTLDSMGRPTLIRYVSIYMLIVGIFSICGGVLLFIGGAAAGVGGALGAAALSGTTDPEAQQAAQALGAAAGLSGILLIYGILSIISGPALFVVGWGLRSRAPWARMGVVVAGGIHVLVSLIGLLTGGGGIFSILWLVVDALIVYAFYSDAGIKAELGGN